MTEKRFFLKRPDERKITITEISARQAEGNRFLGWEKVVLGEREGFLVWLESLPETEVYSEVLDIHYTLDSGERHRDRVQLGIHVVSCK